ncbi:MAG TPA: HAD family phosphatase [Candidatus Saccharimonadales bacterium]|nr:HAD family phosphatase [Candidatus Saccharimonadales bacterium]
MAARPFAVFDIDGTVIRWQLYHALGDRLVKNGQIDAAVFQRVRDSRMNWKKRVGEDSFREYEQKLVRVFTASLAGMRVEDFRTAADAVFDEYKDQVYTYTRDLIRRLKADNYLLFAISGSPSIVIEKLADYYGFDDFAATNYPAKAGRLTGEQELSLGKKHELLEQLIAKHGASRARSIAVGDSEGDISMLAMVERPIAFNPSKQLFEHARKQGWEIIVERKNVVYELEENDGQYRLAT